MVSLHVSFGMVRDHHVTTATPVGDICRVVLMSYSITEFGAQCAPDRVSPTGGHDRALFCVYR